MLRIWCLLWTMIVPTTTKTTFTGTESSCSICPPDFYIRVSKNWMVFFAICFKWLKKGQYAIYNQIKKGLFLPYVTKSQLEVVKVLFFFKIGSLWSILVWATMQWWACYFPLYTVHRVGRTGRAGNEGFAFTFITKEQVIQMLMLFVRLNMNDFQQVLSQDWYSGDVIKALELSGSLVPQVIN